MQPDTEPGAEADADESAEKRGFRTSDDQLGRGHAVEPNVVRAVALQPRLAEVEAVARFGVRNGVAERQVPEPHLRKQKKQKKNFVSGVLVGLPGRPHKHGGIQSEKSRREPSDGPWHVCTHPHTHLACGSRNPVARLGVGGVTSARLRNRTYGKRTWVAEICSSRGNQRTKEA